LKILLVANCQIEAIRWFFGSHHDVEKLLTIPLHLINSKAFDRYKSEFERFYNPSEYLVLTFFTADSHKEFSSKELSLSNPNVYTFTNLFFSGLHPDITYLGNMGRRIQSPLGDYHSKIILHSYLQNTSVEACIKSFNQKTYELFKYFDEFNISTDNLMKRDESISIKFAKEFIEKVKNTPSLYTINHPTGEIFQELSFLIASKIGLKLARTPNSMLPNHLSNSTWWPIYPEIADFFHLKYETPFIFKQPMSRGGKFLSLENFVLSSYRLYHENDHVIRGAKIPKLFNNLQSLST
jgi:hypothetical protein